MSTIYSNQLHINFQRKGTTSAPPVCWVLIADIGAVAANRRSDDSERKSEPSPHCALLSAWKMQMSCADRQAFPVEYSDRLTALREAYRVIKPGGMLFAAAVSRFASLIDGVSRGFFGDVGFRDIIAADLAAGHHRNPTNNPAYFTTAYFHRPEELADELREAGFKAARLLAIEGPVWSAAHFRDAWAEPGERERLMQFLSIIEAEPSITGSSAHFVAVAYR